MSGGLKSNEETEGKSQRPHKMLIHKTVLLTKLYTQITSYIHVAVITSCRTNLINGEVNKDCCKVYLI